jgi:hypothetical protein
MHFDLQALIPLNTIYSTWMSPFIKEEIDVVIKHMPADKALSPDGFNGLFLKKCWHIIKEDIYNLCQDFYNGIVDIQPLNNALITLVLKINTSTSVNDFTNISHQLCHKNLGIQITTSYNSSSASQSVWLH